MVVWGLLSKIEKRRSTILQPYSSSAQSNLVDTTDDKVWVREKPPATENISCYDDDDDGEDDNDDEMKALIMMPMTPMTPMMMMLT